MKKYSVRIPILVFEPGGSKLIDDHDRYLSATIEAESPEKAVAAFVQGVFCGEEVEEVEAGGMLS